MLSAWPAPSGEELALTFDRGRPLRIVISPAWFDESNKLRHFTVELMRALDRSGIDSFLPDLPGQNESLADLTRETPDSWRNAMALAAKHFGATHTLAIRAGAAIAPDLSGWFYAPLAPQKQLHAMIRARLVTSRHAGENEDRATLLAEGAQTGLDLAGYRLGAEMVGQLADMGIPAGQGCEVVSQDRLPGSGLWLRSEPDFDPSQVLALSDIIAQVRG